MLRATHRLRALSPGHAHAANNSYCARHYTPIAAEQAGVRQHEGKRQPPQTRGAILAANWGRRQLLDRMAGPRERTTPQPQGPYFKTQNSAALHHASLPIRTTPAFREAEPLPPEPSSPSAAFCTSRDGLARISNSVPLTSKVKLG